MFKTNSPVFQLNESAYYFNSALSAVNLIPDEWNGFTVTDGLVMTEETVSALAWRDVYLATVIDSVSAELTDKYIGGKGIVIDKDTWTISRVNCKQKFNFVNGLGFKEDWNNYVYIKLDSSYDNRLTINNDTLLYETSAQSISSDNDNITTSAEAFITTGADYYSEFPQNCGFIYVDNVHHHFTSVIHGGYPGYRKNGNYSVLDNFNVLEIASGTNIENYSAKNYKVYYYPSELSGDVPDFVVNEVITPISSTSISWSFSPNDNDTVECDGITASGGWNFISGDVNMVPENVLIIW